jgi:hypothetical protein
MGRLCPSELHVEEVSWVHEVGASEAQSHLGPVPCWVGPDEAPGRGLEPGIQEGGHNLRVVLGNCKVRGLAFSLPWSGGYGDEDEAWPTLSPMPTSSVQSWWKALPTREEG